MNWIRKLLYGRYGGDMLGRAMIFVSLAALLVQWFSGWTLFYIIAMLILVISYLRIFSKNITARRAENEAFLKWWLPVWSRLSGKLTGLSDMRTHVHCKCPGCGQKIRVPRGRGRINICCPKCRRDFIKKT